MSGLVEEWRSTYIRFRPPKNNSPFIRFVQKIVLPLIMPLNTGITMVKIDDEDLQRLRGLKNKRVIITPNHSEGNEPYVVFHLSKLLGHDFNYLTAREVFERYFPAGRLLQAVGCYSVIRGTPDREAYRMTKKLLIEGKRWLVAFPEGTAAGMGDLVMPFQEGICRIAFSASEDLAGTKPGESVYLLPVAIKPVCPDDMSGTISGALSLLETRIFGAPSGGSVSFHARLTRLGQAVFAANERVYGIRPEEGETLNERFNVLKQIILSRIGGAVGLDQRPGESESDYIRELFNAIDRIVYAPKGENGYQEKVLREQRLAIKPLYDTLLRVFQFVGFDTRYIDENPTIERFLDVLGLLEYEVLGKRRFYRPRTALVKIGTPVDLAQYAGRYREDKRNTVSEVTVHLRSAVQSMLNALSSRSHPIMLRDG
jgi:1-acyl-sn-glycerol-3-phosphate acyltransferase